MDSILLKKLREWFRKNAVSLPWRPADLDAPRDPYAVWISETMLQQTQVSTVRDYFVRWMERFPDIATLASAPEEEVFRYWQGLGYYSRARNILKTAQKIDAMARPPSGGSGQAPSVPASRKGIRRSTMPTTRKELETLPGIGAYTAGAILSLAYHQREAILDGNLVRIFSRFYALDFLPTDKNAQPKTGQPQTAPSKKAAEIYWDFAREIASSDKAYLHNEALMELGRTVCKVKNPSCTLCPLHTACRAFAESRVSEFPPAKRHVQKEWHGTVLVIESADHKIFAIHGGQKFFRNQFTLPHFESARNKTGGLPAEAERYLDADAVVSTRDIGRFRHSITVHKIECDVVHVRLGQKAPAKTAPETRWVPREEARDFFSNSFSLKALGLLPTDN